MWKLTLDLERAMLKRKIRWEVDYLHAATRHGVPQEMRATLNLSDNALTYVLLHFAGIGTSELS